VMMKLIVLADAGKLMGLASAGTAG